MILIEYTRPRLHYIKNAKDGTIIEVQTEFKNTSEIIIDSKLLNLAGQNTRVLLVETLHRRLIV